MTSAAMSANHERFLRSNNSLRVSKKLATASRGRRQVEIVISSIGSAVSRSSCSSSDLQKKLEAGGGGGHTSANLPPIRKEAAKARVQATANRAPVRISALVQTYSTRYRSKSTSANDRRLPYSSPTTFGENKLQNKSKLSKDTLLDSSTSSACDDVNSNNTLHQPTSSSPFSCSWPKTAMKESKKTSAAMSSSSGMTSGLPSCKDECDVIDKSRDKRTTTRGGKATPTTTTTTTKRRVKRKGKKTKSGTDNSNSSGGHRSPEVVAAPSPEVDKKAAAAANNADDDCHCDDVTADDCSNVAKDAAAAAPIVVVSDGNEFYDDLEERCRRWIAEVARERLENPDKIFLPHLLLP